MIYLKDTESHKLPREGIFWFYDADCIACYSIPVNIENIFEYKLKKTVKHQTKLKCLYKFTKKSI